MVGIQLRDKVVWSDVPLKRIIRFPDSESVGAQTVVASIATAYGLKGAWYAANAQDLLENALRITYEYLHKKHPLSWWRSRLVEGLFRGGTVTVQQEDIMVKQGLQPVSHTPEVKRPAYAGAPALTCL